MFEKRPIWGIIVGLNVCVLIWLISVQEPVMYDASTAIITSGMQQQQHQQVSGGAASLSEFGVLSSSRGSRQDRDIKEKPPHYLENWASTLTTFNLSRNYSMNVQHATILKNRSENIGGKTTTDAISLLTGSPALTSSLGTGDPDVKVSPTPSWKKLTAVSSVLPYEDFNRLIDLQHFHYLVPQPVCSSEIQTLILVHSAPGNHEKRQLIRDTWASVGRNSLDAPLRVLFLLGAVEDEQLQNELLLENNQFADIVQGSFVDDYRNMTYKHVMGFKWFLYNCPQAQILIKVDDDVYVNTPQLLKYLEEEQKRSTQTMRPPPTPPSHQHKQQQKRQQKNKKSKDQKNQKSATPASNNIIATTTTKDSPPTAAETTKSNFIIETLGIFTNSLANDSEESATASPLFNASENLFHRPQNLLFCQKIIGSLVKRSYRSKWRVGFKEYAGRYYPPYCPGYAIIYSPDVIFRLYTAAQTSKYFWIDDVHITGVLAQQTNTTITTSSRYVLYSNECDRLLMGKTDLKAVEFLFAWHSITAPQIKALWHLQIKANNNSASDLANNHQKADNSSSSFIWTSNDRLSYNISNTLTEEGLR